MVPGVRAQKEMLESLVIPFSYVSIRRYAIITCSNMILFISAPSSLPHVSTYSPTYFLLLSIYLSNSWSSWRSDRLKLGRSVQHIITLDASKNVEQLSMTPRSLFEPPRPQLTSSEALVLTLDGVIVGEIWDPINIRRKYHQRRVFTRLCHWLCDW